MKIRPRVRFRQNGFTLIEILIVIAVIMLLAIIVLINMRGQTARAYDLKRKADLYKLHQSFQDYLNDKDEAPPKTIVDTCDSTDLVPYIQRIPCDPQSKKPYGYFPTVNGSGAYRICAILSDPHDPTICQGPLGCGVGGGYNYCLASGVQSSAVGTEDEGGGLPTPTPTPTPIPGGAYACAPPDTQGRSYCNHYMDPSGSGCSVIFQDNQCMESCDDPATPKCAQ